MPELGTMPSSGVLERPKRMGGWQRKLQKYERRIGELEKENRELRDHGEMLKEAIRLIEEKLSQQPLTPNYSRFHAQR